MKRSTVTGLLAAILLGVAAGRIAAQAPDTSTVDHIVAVVGSKAITLSQVQEEVYARASSGRERLPDATKEKAAFDKAMTVMSRRYVDTLIAFELLFNEASGDTTIKVTDQEVNDAVDLQVNNARKRFKTDAEFRAQLKEIGFNTIEDWRTKLAAQQRRTFMVERFVAQLKEEKKIQAMTPTAKEIRAFYDSHIEDWGKVPALISFKQIAVTPVPSDTAKASAKKLADSLVLELRKPNADFGALAKRFSMDAKSAADGGNLDFFQRGLMVREFEDVAFSLAPGTISEPVESPFGYHIIQVQRKQPGAVQARHILIMWTIDTTGARVAHERAEAIVAALAKGASFDSLQHLYHDRIEEMELNSYPIDSLSTSPYGPAVAGVDSGKVTKAFALPSPTGLSVRDKWAVLMVTRRTPIGAPTFDDVKGSIRRILGEQMGETDYINRLRARTYIDIRDP